MSKDFQEFVKAMNKEGIILSGLGQIDTKGNGKYEWVCSVRPYDDFSLGHGRDQDYMEAMNKAYRSCKRKKGMLKRTKRKKVEEVPDKKKKTGRVRVKRTSS